MKNVLIKLSGVISVFSRIFEAFGFVARGLLLKKNVSEGIFQRYQTSNRKGTVFLGNTSKGFYTNKGQVMSAVLIQDRLGSEENDVDKNFFGEKVGFLAKLFGCGHQDLSRPFSQGKSGYRVCLHCGARRHFDPETLKTFGSFYYPPIHKAE
ncbi:MAG TPA: hypothetical protein PKY59_25635 [Pyrinomonadaceae bacterium]|nr:hypothetical protein [Pyrinomonadaceae bacterium]